MGLFDLFKRPKTEQEQYYEEYDRRQAQNATFSERPPVNSYQQMAAPISPSAEDFRITVEDVFAITGRGTVITGRIATGTIHVGDTVTLQRVNGSCQQVQITGIESFRKMLDSAGEGTNVGLLVQGLTKADIGKGDVLTKTNLNAEPAQYYAPISSDSCSPRNFRMTIEDVFTLAGRGTVLWGRIEFGSVSVIDEITLLRADGSTKKIVVTGIEMYKKVTKTAVAGEDVGLVIQRLSKDEVAAGDVVMR